MYKALLIIAVSWTMGITYGQSILEQTYTINFKDASLTKCIHQLESQTGESFSFNSKQLAEEPKTVTAKFKDASLMVILDEVFKGTSFLYKEIGSQISIYRVNSTTGSVVLSGYMRDSDSKEEIIGARIYFPELGIGCVTNSYGYYAIEIPKGSNTYVVRSIGMNTIVDTLVVNEDMLINFNLTTSNEVLDAIEVKLDTLGLNDNPPDLSTTSGTSITKRNVYELPAVAGEVDLIKYMQQLPGVQPTESGGANFQVRGLSAGSNLILIDEIPVYHPTHMLGVFSIVNVEAIRSATLHKDFVPLKFGGKSSSVLQIHTNEGNLSKTHFSGGLSPAGGRLNLEGPFVKQKASYYLSARSSFFPRIAFNLLGSPDYNLPFYYDVNGKINIHINSNNRIYFTGYYGQDRLTDTTYRHLWGNTAGSFRWNHVIDTKTFTNLSLTHSQFRYGYENVPWNDDIPEGIYSQVVYQDKIRYDVTNYYSNTLKLEFGLDASWIQTNKAKAEHQSTNLFLDRSAIENGFYFSAEKKVNQDLTITAGVRLPYSFHFGKQDTVNYLNNDLTFSEVIYEKNKIYDFLVSVDPRLLINYKLGKRDQLSFSAGIMSQHTHMVNYQNEFLTVGIWTTSNRFLKPERTHSTSIGWVHQERIMQFSATAYYRYTTNVIDYALPLAVISQDIESNLLSGTLKAYGVECQLNFTPNKNYTASLSYTYAKTEQQVDGINNNNPYPALYDRPHYFNFNQYISFNEKWKMGSNIIYHSGTAVTLPSGQFMIGNTAFPVFPEERNAERLRETLRLDLAFIRVLGVKKKKYWGDLRLTITNLLGRVNYSTVFMSNTSFGGSELYLFGRDFAPRTIVLSLNFKI